MSLLVVFFADVLGRKPVISITIVGYALFTLFTALSSGVGMFTLFQTGATDFSGCGIRRRDHHDRGRIPR